MTIRTAGTAIAIGAAGAAALVASGSMAHAQAWPTRPILMVIPLQAGSAVDAMMRIVAQKMSENMGQQIVIENQPGAAGLIGAERLARAAPDGYTIAGLNDGLLTMMPNLREKIPYDPQKSFAPASQVAGIVWVMIATPSLPVKSVREFVALAKARPDEVNFSSGGNGSPQHVAMELFKSLTGARMQHVPYRGATQAALDVVGGQVPVMFTALSIVQGHVQSGKVRALGVGGPKRSTLFPQVPTVEEAGVKGFQFGTWGAIAAPAGTPRDIVARLNAEVVKAVQSPDVRDRLVGQSLDPIGSTPEQLAEIIRIDLARMGHVIRTAGIRLDP
jgi:tripartite-type tricarboxylate transporter receptor subunit TctC